jgi:lipopolysaccharide export system permease protein
VPQAQIFATLFVITITVMLIKILGQAAGGKVASGDVLALIAFTSLMNMPILLILTGFISVLLVVTRAYQDSEMVVWFASGLSLRQWIGPSYVLVCRG